MSSKGLVFWIVLVFVIISLINFVLARLVWVRGESVKYFLFLREERKELKKGDYVLVKGKPGTYAEGKILTKKVMCLYPYRLKKEGLSFYCCSVLECEYLHTAQRKSLKGKDLYIFHPCRNGEESCIVEIPEGKYYLGTDVPIGYDSRYMGFFDRAEIISVLFPLF